MLNLLGRMTSFLMHKWNRDESATGGAQPFKKIYYGFNG